MKSTLRWILVVPAAVLGFYAALFLGIVLYEGLGAVCPERYLVSEQCAAGAAGIAQDLIELLAASLAAVFVVLFAAGMAPNHKHVVAWTAYAVGAAAATLLAAQGEFGIPYAGAIIAGFVTALVIHRNYRQSIESNRGTASPLRTNDSVSTPERSR